MEVNKNKYEVYEYHSKNSMNINNLDNRVQSLGFYKDFITAETQMKNEIEFMTTNYDDGNYWKADLKLGGMLDGAVCGATMYYNTEEFTDNNWNKEDWCYEIGIREVI